MSNEYEYYMDDDRDIIAPKDSDIPFECPFNMCLDITPDHYLCWKMSIAKANRGDNKSDDMSWFTEFRDNWNRWKDAHPLTEAGDKHVISRSQLRALSVKIDSFFGA